MAIATKTKADGYFKVSEGAAQIQLRNTSETLGSLHSPTAPSSSVPSEFMINGSGIEFSLGKNPCYVMVLSDGIATFAYEDIS